MKINHITLLVKDRERSVKFYTEVLGLELKNVGDHKWIIVGDSYIHLTENSGEPVADTFYHFALETGDFKDLKLKFADISLPDSNDDQIFVRDPDGNLIEFIDEHNQFFK